LPLPLPLPLKTTLDASSIRILKADEHDLDSNEEAASAQSNNNSNSSAHIASIYHPASQEHSSTTLKSKKHSLTPYAQIPIDQISSSVLFKANKNRTASSIDSSTAWIGEKQKQHENAVDNNNNNNNNNNINVENKEEQRASGRSNKENNIEANSTSSFLKNLLKPSSNKTNFIAAAAAAASESINRSLASPSITQSKPFSAEFKKENDELKLIVAEAESSSSQQQQQQQQQRKSIEEKKNSSVSVVGVSEQRTAQPLYISSENKVNHKALRRNKQQRAKKDSLKKATGYSGGSISSSLSLSALVQLANYSAYEEVLLVHGPEFAEAITSDHTKHLSFINSNNSTNVSIVSVNAGTNKMAGNESTTNSTSIEPQTAAAAADTNGQQINLTLLASPITLEQTQLSENETPTASSNSKSYSPQELDTKKRQKADEYYHMEAKQSNLCQILATEVYQKLREENTRQQQRLCDEEDMKKIFYPVIELEKLAQVVHGECSAEIKQRLEADWAEKPYFGDILFKYFPYYRIYKSILQRYPTSQVTLSNILKRKPFASYIRKLLVGKMKMKKI
jgi:hypothetical protein